MALEAGLGEIPENGIESRIAADARAGASIRSAWTALGLRSVAGDHAATP